MKKNLKFVTLTAFAMFLTFIFSFLSFSNPNKKNNILLDYNTVNADAVTSGLGAGDPSGGGGSSEGDGEADSECGSTEGEAGSSGGGGK